MMIFRSVKVVISLIIIGLCCSSALAYNEQPQGLAANMLSQLQDSSQVDYINVGNWLIDNGEENNEKSSLYLEKIATNVLKNNKRVFVDFTTIEDESKKDKAKQFFAQQIGVSFPENYLVITKHKNELMFAPIEGIDDPSLKLLDAHEQEKSVSKGM